MRVFIQICFSYFLVDSTGKVVTNQEGVFRSNCMDCLDRTNVIQSLLARRSLQAQLQVQSPFFFYYTSYQKLNYLQKPVTENILIALTLTQLILLLCLAIRGCRFSVTVVTVHAQVLVLPSPLALCAISVLFKGCIQMYYHLLFHLGGYIFGL